MHWTTLSDYEIFANQSMTDGPSGEPLRLEEIVIGEARLVVARGQDGQASIVRLISPRASDYLRPEWQPGLPYRQS